MRLAGYAGKPRETREAGEKSGTGSTQRSKFRKPRTADLEIFLVSPVALFPLVSPAALNQASAIAAEVFSPG